MIGKVPLFLCPDITECNNNVMSICNCSGNHWLLTSHLNAITDKAMPASFVSTYITLLEEDADICIPRLGHSQAGWFTPASDLSWSPYKYRALSHPHLLRFPHMWVVKTTTPSSPHLISSQSAISNQSPDRPDPPCRGDCTAVESQMLKYRLFTFNPEPWPNQTRPGWAEREGRRRARAGGQLSLGVTHSAGQARRHCTDQSDPSLASLATSLLQSLKTLGEQDPDGNQIISVRNWLFSNKRSACDLLPKMSG